MPPGPIHLHIAEVLTAVPANVGVEAGMVMLTEDEAPYRSLRIIIGQPEANAILAGWHGAIPGRPSTWDLFVSTVALLEGRIDRVVITAVHEERHYFAHIEFEQAEERRILACRPSDAIALAVRAYNVDILAEESVMEAAGVLPDGTKPGQVAEEPGGEPVNETDSLLAAREAALAAREAELAERERRLTAREGEGGTEPATAVGTAAAPVGGETAEISGPEAAVADLPGVVEPGEVPGVPPGPPHTEPGVSARASEPATGPSGKGSLDPGPADWRPPGSDT